jgi:hypothetical protein
MNNVLYQRHKPQHAYNMGNCVWLATEAVKCTKKSYGQVSFTANNSKYSYYKHTGTTERKPCSTTKNLRTENDTPKQKEIVWKRQQSEQTTNLRGPPTPENGDKSSFRNIAFSSFQNTGRCTKSKIPVIVRVMHHCQSPLKSTNTKEPTLMKIMQESFTRLQKVSSKQAKQMSTVMNPLTTAFNKWVKQFTYRRYWRGMKTG